MEPKIVSNLIIQYNLSLADLASYDLKCLSRLLVLLMKSGSPLVAKASLKKLHQAVPQSLTAMKCLC
jgi:hypothetical protein